MKPAGFTSVLLGIALLAGLPAMAAEPWPAKPVRMIVPFGPGSGSEQFARVIANEFQGAFQQSFVVDPRPGAAGFIAAEYVARAQPDGYTLFVSSSSVHAVNPHQFRKLPYEPLKDFTPIGRICTVPHIVVVDAKLPIRTIAELIAAGSGGNRLTYAYGNSAGQIGGASFGVLAKLNVTGIPYKSTPQAMTDVAGGQVAFMMVDLASSQALLQAGRVRAIAAATESPSALAPQLPTIAATAGIGGFDLTGWSVLLGPAGMPAELVRRLNEELRRTLAKKEVADKILSLGCEIASGSPADLEQYMKQQVESFGRKFRDAGILPE